MHCKSKSVCGIIRHLEQGGIPCAISAAGCWAGNLFIIVDTADVCRFVRYGLAAFFVFILFVFWPYGFIWLSLFFFVVNLVLPYG